MKRHFNKNIYIYIVLMTLVVMVLIRQMFNHNYSNVFLCIMTLVLFMVPSFINKTLNINLPNTLEIIILLSIFCSEILGEIQQYYISLPYWDSMLHAINGFITAAIGFSLVDILNQNEKIHLNMSPLFVGLVAFCFSMTAGVLWEFFEFTMDMFFKTDMQKDAIISSISSVLLNPNHSNVAVEMPIENIVINAKEWHYGGYIDIGLIDTMTDLFVNCLGAIVFSIFGILYIKGRGEGNFIKNFLLTIKKK